MRTRFEECLRENMKQCCVPDGFESMDIHDYDSFLEQRRILMAEKIHYYYNTL